MAYVCSEALLPNLSHLPAAILIYIVRLLKNGCGGGIIALRKTGNWGHSATEQNAWVF